MTSATFRTLREACGLSQQAAAEFFAVALSTVKHWEAGRNGIPPGAVAELRALNAAIEARMERALAPYREQRPEVVVLTRYRHEADWPERGRLDGAASGATDVPPIPWTAYPASLGRTLLALERAGARVTVLWA